MTRLGKQNSVRQSCPRSRLCWALTALLMTQAALGYAQATAPAPETAVETTTAPETPVDSAEEHPPISRSERDNQLLVQASPDEAQWLETPQGQILAFYRPTENRVTKGAVLLLHAAEMPPGWPASLENLRRNLPQHGWVTLAVALPERYPTPIPTRDVAELLAASEEIASEDAGAQQESSNTSAEPAEAGSEHKKEPAIARAELIDARVNAAVEFLRKQGQLNLVILVDNSSILDSLLALQSPQAEMMQALVLINLQPQETLSGEQLTTLFSSSRLPVMDVFLEPNDAQQRATRKAHRAIAMRNKLTNYQQFSLPPLRTVDIDNARSFWLERIRGFMEQNASGKEIQTSGEDE